jgi:hypothetical protein
MVGFMTRYGRHKGIRVAKTSFIPLKSGVLSDTMKHDIRAGQVKPFDGKALTPA